MKGGEIVGTEISKKNFKLCSNCYHHSCEMPLDIRKWACLRCGTYHDQDGNVATNIRTESLRMLVCGWNSRLYMWRGSKTKRRTQVGLEAFPMNLEANAVPTDSV
jgi:putative transposase